MVDSNGKVEVRTATLGPQAGDDVVVENGVEAGETIIVEGLQKVRPGMTVATQPFTTAPKAADGQE